MTAVHDPPLPTGTADADEAGFPRIDLALIQLVIEHAARATEPSGDTEQSGDTEPSGRTGPSGCSEAELIDQIQQIESLQNCVAALQASRIRAFVREHVGNGIAAGRTDPERLERGAVAQVALACHTSPAEARTRIRAARDLREGLDHVREAFISGRLSAVKVATVVAACSDLDPDERARVDARLALHDLGRLGIGRLRDLARRLAAEIAPEKFRARVEAARAERRVTLRPAPDAMVYLTGYLPVEQGVACLAALQKAFVQASVDPAPLTRSRGQVLADTLVERLTGREKATDINVDVQVVVPVEALLDPASPLPAEIPGHGPVPVELLATATGRKTVRRLLTRAGTVIGGDSRRRAFTGLLAELVRARDGNRCTEPYCGAPIRHVDHIRRVADGGRTTLDNGRGTCEFHNHVREQPGWRVDRTPDGVRTTTPTGHTYLTPSRAPNEA